LLRVSDPTAAPAVLKGGPLPADLSQLNPGAGSIVLNFSINNQPHGITIKATPAKITAGTALTDPVVIGANDREFRLMVNGVLQVITLPELKVADAKHPAD